MGLRNWNVLGRKHQIIASPICRHIVAMADAHYLIEKSVQNQNPTISRIADWAIVTVLRSLRVCGGRQITDTVRKSAKEIKKLAQ